MPWESARKSPAYGTAEWKRARLACLQAARWRCEARLPGCQGAATQADHIDGLPADPRHERLRAVCTSCHRAITAAQGNAARRRGGADPGFIPRTDW